MASTDLKKNISLHCKICFAELAKKDILMLAEVPPSTRHLAVKEGNEDKAYKKVRKEENPKGGRSARYCPSIVRCQECANHVGNLTHVASKLLLCYKVDNLYLFNGVEKKEMTKLSRISETLEQLGVEVIMYLPSDIVCPSRTATAEPMKYCDITGLTHMSHEIDSLTHQIPRNYQRELFLTAMRGNTLVYLPTGSGKTLVAAMVFSCMKQLNPGKFVVFIVDRIPLVYQQSAYFKSQLPHLRVKALTGEMVPFQKKNVYQALADRTVDILVLTHQIFLDSVAVENSAIRFSDISVVVFDEAHHCTGGHPYNVIMNHFYPKVTDSFKPLVLGLTASPAGEITTARTIEKLEMLLKNLNCKLATPIESGDLVAHINAPNTSYEIVTTTDNRQVIFERLILEHITDLQNHIESVPGCQQALQGYSVFSSHFRGALRNLIERCHGDNGKTKALIIGEHVMRMLSVVDISQVICHKDALVCLNDYLNSIIQAISPNHTALQKWIGTHPIFVELSEYVAEAIEHDYLISDRYGCLENRLSQFICQAKEDETSRGIVFVNMRRTAYKLCEKLRVNYEVAELLNPAVFVGHGSGTYDGMAWLDEQESLLQNFRSGVIKLLVSTSVLEEGLDVPVCNFVVRFEGAATLRAFVQSRGRGSRRPGSEFVVICNESQKVSAMNLVVKEENMKDAVVCVMDNASAKTQAEEFKCEVQRPDFTSAKVQAEETSGYIERYNPSITVTVHFFEDNERNDQKVNIVTYFLENEFNVEPTILRPADLLSSIRSCGSELSSKMAFMVQQKSDMRQEFRSEAEFICYVTQLWCCMLTNLDEEPLTVWLHPLIPSKSRKSIELLHIVPASSLFLGTFVTQCHFQYEWPSSPIFKNVILRFDHSFKVLTIFFVLRGRNYKVELQYDEFEDFVLLDSNTTNDEMIRAFFTLRHPPRLYRKVDDDDDNGDDDDDDVGDNNVENPGNNGGDNDVADEGIDDASDMSDSESESQNFSTDDEYPDVIRNFRDRSLPNSSDVVKCWERIVDVETGTNAWGQCFTYCFRIPSKQSMLLRSSLSKLDERFGKKAYYSRVKNTYGRFPNVNIPHELDFDVVYTLESIFKSHPSIRARLNESRVSDLLQNPNPNEVVVCLERLGKALEQNPLCNPERILEAQLARETALKSKQNKSLVPNHCALIRRVVITPTRILLHPPEVMIKNRVLRHYATDEFICVSIREENLSKLSMGRGSIDNLLDHINGVLNEGLNIAGINFQFLGSSNSQLRNHSCWFVGPNLLPEDLRQWMGDFSDIRCVATHMARIGLCFSTSVDTVKVDTRNDEMYSEEEDVTTADNDYIFSDGVGRISKELAVEVSKRLGKACTPSAFQIRFSGYKGVLALDPTLAGRKASFRPSMRKFESNHQRLEVTHTSRPQAVYLNHQVIMLLSNLGVPDEAFISLQKQMLDRLSDMLVNETDAIQFLGNRTKIGISYHTLSNAGIQLTTEPFFKSLLVAMHRNHIHELLSRARILLPQEEARLMMGVMDEPGVLKPGQVFVQYSAVSTQQDGEHEFNTDDKRCLIGPVVVTRNPCLHPGDVRQLEAVEAPSLNHLVDCIVFPRCGLRPHPNEMSGGDLDGDLYFVCWKKSLLPNKQNFSPMDYKALQKKEESEPITSTHMTKFVVDYIRSDQLGAIDNSHKALADQEKAGVQSDICLHLAELHSLAVDAPKTGMWPKIPQTKLEKYPDFMMKSDKPSYTSENLLGKLYRRCEKFKDTTSENCNQKMRIDESFMLPGQEKYIVKARELYHQYRDKMEALMRLYGIHSEAEIFTGCFLKLRNRLPKEKSKIVDIVSETVLRICCEFRRVFFDEFGMDEQRLNGRTRFTKEVYQKASAWYAATYTYEENWEQLQKKRLVGFPWIVDNVMSIIKSQQHSAFLPRSLNLNIAVGQSFLQLFNEEKMQLLEELKKRIRVKMLLSAHLQMLKPNLLIFFTGSTRTLLFHHKSNMNLCVLPSNQTNCDTDVDMPDQKNNLESLVNHLNTKVVKGETKKPEKENLFDDVRLHEKKHFPTISCMKPTEKLTTATQCSPNLVCDLSSCKVSLLVASLLSSFIEKYPHLLLILRVTHRWSRVTGLSRNSAETESTSNVLSILFLAHCISRDEIESFQADEVFQKLLQCLRGEENEINLCMQFEKNINIFGDQANATLEERELNITNLGRMLISFFQSYESAFDMIIPEPFDRVLRGQKFSDLIDENHLILIQDHMQRAYQLLAQYGDVEILLACSSSEDYKVIFLSPLLSLSVSGVEKSKAKEIAAKTGAASVIIRSNLPRTRKSTILEVRGNQPAIRAVHKELDKMTVKASENKWSLMGGSFVEGASLMLFEGSKSVNDTIILTPYNGPCHQTHDGLARHLAFVKNPTITQYMFSRFAEKFLQQFEMLKRDFVSQLHGVKELAVHFGRMYLFSIPHLLLEDSDAVSIAMLKTNKLKIGMQRTKRNTPQEIRYVNQEEERVRRTRMKPKKVVKKVEETKKRVWKRGKPSRSSFYTVVHSAERVKSFLQNHGFQPDDADAKETYLVNIYREDIEFYVQFDHALKFTEVRFPNLRWCVADIKRMWQSRQDRVSRQDSEQGSREFILDGREIDIRFLLQTHSILKSDEISGTTYEQYTRMLKPTPSDSKPFTVEEELWKDVRIIRFTKSRKFSPSAGSHPDFASALIVYLNEVREISRPCENPNIFNTEITRWEVSVKSALPEDFATKKELRKYLSQIWDFAFALSTYVSDF